MNAHSLMPPRSILHRIQPIGMGTGQVESLTSYFCRLASSHCSTTNGLTGLILDLLSPDRWVTFQSSDGKSRYVWHERSISGVSDGAQTWASILSQMTGFSGLDRLTMLSLNAVVSPKALMAQSARWCAQCFDEDLTCGRSPYFRLVWDIGANKVCARHKCSLTSVCSVCLKSNVRHASTFVMPGWCTSCHSFLGQTDGANQESLENIGEFEFFCSEQIENLLATISGCEAEPFFATAESLHQAIHQLIVQMDGGVSSHFARRVGVRKSTVSHWQSENNPLTLEVLCKLSISCGVTLFDLLQGRLEKWKPPVNSQVGFDFGERQSKRRELRRHNWPAIREYLEKELSSNRVRSLAEIGRELEIDDRHLYLQATSLAQKIGQRYVESLSIRTKAKEQYLFSELNQALEEIESQGDAPTIERLYATLGRDKVNSIKGLYSYVSRWNARSDQPRR